MPKKLLENKQKVATKYLQLLFKKLMETQWLAATKHPCLVPKKLMEKPSDRSLQNTQF